MSDNWIKLIPEDPHFVPAPAQQMRARERFQELAPEADQIEIQITKTIQFFDCGANFETIRCPSCGAEIPMEWWQVRMDDDYARESFQLLKYESPCCHAPHTLHELIYKWPQGFGRFAIDVMNPRIGELSDERINEFEKILGTRLRVIYQHV